MTTNKVYDKLMNFALSAIAGSFMKLGEGAQLFAINIDTASFRWENKINSSLRSSLVENYLFSISLEGFLFVTDVNSGNIIRITDIFKNFKSKVSSTYKSKWTRTVMSPSNRTAVDRDK